MNFSIKTLSVVLLFFLFHILDIWPLPVPFYTLVSEVTTLLFFVEIAFYIYYRSQIKELQWFNEPPSYSDSRSPVLRAATFRSFLSSLSLREWGDCADAAAFFPRWFQGSVTRTEDIRRGNLTQWLAWSFFYRLPPMLTDAEKNELENMITVLESRLKVRFPPGHSPSQRPMRLTLDPVSATHRLLSVYALQALGSSVSKLVLRLVFGFTRKKLGGFHYWYRPRGGSHAEHDSSRSTLPLVFIHGLGQGLVSYLHFLYHARHRDVFLLELSHISARVWERVPDPLEVATSVECMLQEHDYARAVFMAHSFGTFATAWCIKYKPHIVHSAMLIDPVTLLLCHPTTCHTFVYRSPRSAADWVRRFTVAQETGIVRVMMRNFWWRENALFAEDIPPALPLGDAPDRYAYYPRPSAGVTATVSAAKLTVMTDDDATSESTSNGTGKGMGKGKDAGSGTATETDTCLFDALSPLSPPAPDSPCCSKPLATDAGSGDSAAELEVEGRDKNDGENEGFARPVLPFTPVPTEVDAYGVFPICGLTYNDEGKLGHWRLPHTHASTTSPATPAPSARPGAGASAGSAQEQERLRAFTASLAAVVPAPGTGADAPTTDTYTPAAIAAAQAAELEAWKQLHTPAPADAAAAAAAAANDADSSTGASKGASKGGSEPSAPPAAPRIKIAIVLAGHDDLLPADRVLNHMRLLHAYTHAEPLAALHAAFPAPHPGNATTQATAAATGTGAGAVGDTAADAIPSVGVEGSLWGPLFGPPPLPPRGVLPRPEAEWGSELPSTLATTAPRPAEEVVGAAGARERARRGRVTGAALASTAAAAAAGAGAAGAGAATRTAEGKGKGKSKSCGSEPPSSAAADAATRALPSLLRTRILFEPDGGHGHFLFSSSTRRRLLSLVPWLADEV